MGRNFKRLLYKYEFGLECFGCHLVPRTSVLPVASFPPYTHSHKSFKWSWVCPGHP